jgi:hypothetical protein
MSEGDSRTGIDGSSLVAAIDDRWGKIVMQAAVRLKLLDSLLTNFSASWTTSGRRAGVADIARSAQKVTANKAVATR